MAAEMTTILMVHISAFSLVLTKYLSIFHGPFLAIFDERKLLKKLKMTILILPTILVTIQYTVLSTNFEHLANFQNKFYGYYKPISRSEIITKFLKNVNFVSAISLYFYIEYRNGLLQKIKNHFKNSLCCKKTSDSTNKTELFGYQIQIIRLVIFFLCLTLLVSIIKLPRKWHVFYTITMMTVFVPLVVIFKHDGLTKTAVKLLKNIFVEPMISLKF